MIGLGLKSVLAHKVRLAMTALAIVLGVAFVAGTYVFTDSIKASFDSLFSDVDQGVDLYVRGVTEFGFSIPMIDEGLVAEVAAVPGVQRAVPSVDGLAQLVGKDGKPIGGNGPPTLGFSYLPEGEGLTPVALREGDWPRDSGDLVIDSFAADANGIVVGDEIEVIVPAGVETFTVTGIVTFGDADNLLGATLAIFEFETAQRLFDATDLVTSIAVVIEEGFDGDAVGLSIAALLPERVEVVTGEQQTADNLEEVNEGLGFLNTILLVIAGVAVFVGAFLIQNTFRIIVAQRTKELAMLRAVGATGRQVTGMVGIEALAVGVVASAVGILVGVLIAIGLRGAFSSFGFGIPASGLLVKPRTIVVGMTVGVVVTVVAALLPAWKASRVPPVAALREVAAPPRSLGRRIVAGMLATALGAALLLVGLIAKPGNAITLVGVGALVVFIGVSMLAPLVARQFARFVAAPLAKRSLVARLAQENVMRQPRRTAATASALMIGVALVSVIAVFSASAKAGVSQVFEEDFATDFQIRLEGFSDPRITGMPPTLVDELRLLPELGLVVRDRVGEFRWDETSAETFLLAVDGPFHEVVNIEMAEGSAADLGPGRALIALADAERLGVGVGDTVTFQVTSLEKVEVEVAGVFDDEALGVPLIIDMTTYEQVISFRLDRFVYIQVAEGVDPAAARAAIETVTDRYPNADLTDTEELIGDIESQIDGLLNLLVVLLGFAIVIALLGIVNTLALSISERKREIGLLRAVGMSRRQVKRTIRIEAILIALFGGLLGLVVGAILGAAVVLAVGQGLKLTLPAGQMFGYLVAAALGGVLAAMVPARRGARMDILEAISYE